MGRCHPRNISIPQCDPAKHGWFYYHCCERADKLLSKRLAVVFVLACLIAASNGCSRVGLQTKRTTSHTIPGTLRYADIQEPSNLNPLLRLEATSTDLDMFVFGFFFNLDDKMRYVPELALEVPSYQNGGISKDGLTLTYHLRHGVKWQDGEPLTAHDVVFTTHAILNPNNNLQSRSGWDHLASVEAVGDYEVRFHLKKIYAPAIATFFAESGLYPVLPAHLLEKYKDLNHAPFNAHPVGTGPFKFVRWVHGDRIELEANPLYWRGHPGLQHIIYKIIPKETTILVQLQTHEIDAWFRAPTNLYTQMPKLQNEYRIQVAPSLVFSHLDLNQKNPLFQDIRVRHAISYAIDKPGLIQHVSHGVNVPGYSDQSALSWAYNPNVMHYDYDPAKARALLAEAGWKPGADGILTKNGERLTFDVSAVAGGATGEATESIVQQQLKEIGVAVKIKNYPANLFFGAAQDGGILQSGRYDAAFFAWVAGVDPDDYSLYGCDQFPPAGQNNLFWCDPALQQAERGALSTYDQAQRKKFYAITQSEIASQSATIIMWFQRQIFVTSLNLTGFVPAPATSSNWNSWEWSMQ